MPTYQILSDSLGDTTPAAAERFARFCTVAAEKAGFNIDFEINYQMSGYQPDSVGNRISNICWDCDWYGNGPLRKAAIEHAVCLITVLIDNDEYCQ